MAKKQAEKAEKEIVVLHGKPVGTKKARQLVKKYGNAYIANDIVKAREALLLYIHELEERCGEA